MLRGAVGFAGIFILFLAVWSLLGITSTRWEFFVSSPGEVWRLWASELADKEYWDDIQATLIVILFGYALAVIFGYALGILSYWIQRRGVQLNFVLIALGSVPVFALAPLLILAFGTGFPTRVATVVLSCVFLISAGVFQAARKADEDLGSIMRDLKKEPQALWRLIILPGALFYSLPALKGAVALSLIGVFVAEWISSQIGLGRYILSAMSLFDAPRLIIGIGSFMIISSVIMGVISIIEGVTARWTVVR